LITAVPLSIWRATPDFFAKLLSSPVLVNEILPPFLPRIIEQKVLPDDWCTRVFPAQVLATAGVNRGIRVGAVKIFLHLWELGLPKSLASGLGTIMQWAEESLDIAALVLDSADELVTPRTQELFPKVRDLLGRLGKCREPQVRLKLPGILVGNPTVFLQGTLNVEPLVTTLASEKSTEMRIACMTHFLALGSQTSTPGLQEAFFKIFLDYFVDPADEVRDQLCMVATYGHLSAARRAAVAPTLVQFLGTLTDWRNIRDCIEAILSFSREVIRANWVALTTRVFTAVAEYPHPLTSSACSFCGVLSHYLLDEDIPKLIERIEESFMKSQATAMRALFPAIVAEMVVSAPPEVQLGSLVQKLSVLTTDPMSSVQTAVIRALARMRAHYFANDAVKEREVMTMLRALGKSENPHVADVWAAVWKAVTEANKPMSMRARRFQTLPASLSLREHAGAAPVAPPSKAGPKPVSTSKTVHGPQLVRPKLPDSPFG
jgi:hypothetical protein